MQRNIPHVQGRVIERDILTVPTDKILEMGGLSVASPPDLLVGGPPCTPFSKSGYWLKYKREGLDPRALLLREYTRVLREAKPRAFILENVQALTFNNRASRPAFERLLADIDDAGFDVNWSVLNAADYGVPQLRARLFIVGVPKGEPVPNLPVPTHYGPWERRKVVEPDASLQRHIPTSDALRGLDSRPEAGEDVNGRYGMLLHEIPPGENYLHYTRERGHPEPQFRWRSRYWSFLLKLSPDRPAPTIQARPGPYVGPFHWDNRRLRLGELKRLFTFPDDYDFVGSRQSVWSQIGNSVPPAMAQAVASAVREGAAR